MARSKESIQKNNKYIKDNIRIYAFKLNRKFDEEMISYLEGMENKNQYIKDLILKDMENKRVD